MVERVLSEAMEQWLDNLSQQGSVAETIAEVRSVEAGSSISVRTMKWEATGMSRILFRGCHCVGMVFTFLIYMFILMYGNMVMQAVLERRKSGC